MLLPMFPPDEPSPRPGCIMFLLLLLLDLGRWLYRKVRACGWLPLGFALYLTLAVAGAALAIYFEKISQVAAVEWLAPIGLGAFGLWIGISRGHLGQMLLNLNLGALLGVLAVRLSRAGIGVVSLFEGSSRDPDDIEVLLINLSYATLFTWGLCGGLFALLGPATGRLRRRLLRGILGGITIGLTLFFGAYVFVCYFVLEPETSVIFQEFLDLRPEGWVWILNFCLGVVLLCGWLYLAVGVLGCWFFRLERRAAPPAAPPADGEKRGDGPGGPSPLT